MPKQYLGTELVDKIEEGVGFVTGLPGIKQTLNFVGGTVNLVGKTVVDPLKRVAEDVERGYYQPENLSEYVGVGFGNLARLHEYSTGKASEIGGEVAKAVNVDPRIGSFIGETALETAVTAGAGKALGTVGKVAKTLDRFDPPGPSMALAGATAGPNVAFRGGSVNLTPPTVMKAVTTTVPEALEAAGVRTGQDLMDARLGKQLTKRTKDILAKENDIRYLKETLEGLDELKGDPKNLMAFIQEDPDLLYTWNRYTEKYGAEEAFDRTRANIAQRKTNADTAWSQLKSNVLPFEKEGDFSKWYGSDAAKPMRRKAEQILRAKGDLKIKEYLQQHHLIPKGMTAAYFDKMDQLIAAGKAQPDDLIVMAQIALKKGMPTGDVKVNLKDLIPTPHAELHTILRRQGDEVAKTKLIKDLSKVNSVDDLMRKWVKEFSPEGRFTYNYETASIFQELDSLLEELTGISKNVRKRDVREKPTKRR